MIVYAHDIVEIIHGLRRCALYVIRNPPNESIRQRVQAQLNAYAPYIEEIESFTRCDKHGGYLKELDVKE